MLAPFITAQELTDHLGRNVTADPDATMAIGAACDMIRTLTDQSFTRGTATVAMDGTGTDALLLAELPVTAAGTVTVNGGTVTDYVLNGNGILLRGTAGSDPRPVWPMGRQNVRVTYEYGYATVDFPQDLRAVAIQIASRLIVQGVAVEESVGPVRMKYAGAASDLTSTEKIIMSKYRPRR